MDIRTRRDGDEMYIELEGRLDAAWSGTVSQALQDTLHAGCHHIALDLSRVGYLSSAGIRVLVILAKQLHAIGGRLRLVDPSPPVRDVLKQVGLHSLLNSGAMPQATTTPPAPNSARAWEYGEQRYHLYDLNPAAQLHGTLIGQPGQLAPRPAALPITAHTLALGLGALGPGDPAERAGELLAVHGLAIALPGDDPAHPDWLAREGDLIPEVGLVYGLAAEGPFRHLLRFGMEPEALPVALGELAQAALELCQSEQVALVIIAETASLIGAALQTPPGAISGDWFEFPAIRDRMLFTAEPAYTDETCLLVGIVARNPMAKLAEFLRPLAADSTLHGHLHAAVVPYRPVHKGLIELDSSLAALLDSQTVRGMLHLIHDDREGIGAGDSYLRRGALWCAPVVF